MQRITSQEEEKSQLTDLRAGDYEAFEALYSRYAPAVLCKLVMLLKSEESAKDILQDVFCKIWDIREQIDPNKSFAGLLYRMAANLSANAYRKTLRAAFYQNQLDTESSYSPIEESLFQKEDLLLLKKALEKLPERQREVFILHKIEGKSYKEIAESLKITTSAVNQHIQRASSRLRDILNPNTLLFVILFSYFSSKN